MSHIYIFGAYLEYHQIFIALKDIYKTTFVVDWGAFVWRGDAVWNEKWTSNILKIYYQSIQRIFG